MKKIILGLFIGTVVSTIVAYFILTDYGKSQYNQGLNTGKINAKYNLAQKIEHKFGTITEDEKYKSTLFSVKTKDVMIVRINGIKTLRVSP